jgi:hypothetical protein
MQLLGCEIAYVCIVDSPPILVIAADGVGSVYLIENKMAERVGFVPSLA